ncbi:hypothetical protein PR048_022116 [Dryococelus australis]|uniref:Nipped-B protein n=1 Tax=Dryococelus australis TaxID=614101 RepID=A0ABQ9H061_9NEOP|nr:hypothetical protein PR048_022116 [Dryococelus australis]
MDDASGKAVKIKKKKKYCKSTISRNENYLCQGDSLAGKFDQPNPGSRQTDGIMAHESSTEIMKIFGDRNRQLVPVSEKYDAKFIHCIKKVISCKPNLDVNSEEEKENCIPYSKASEKCLENLCKEAAKMKGHRATLLVPSASIKKLFAVLERNIAKGVEMLHTDNVIEGLEKPNVTKEKLTIAADSALAILYILTSPDMPRNIYSEVILERVAMFLKYYGEYILPASSPTNEHELKSNDFGKLQEAGLYDKLKKILSLFLELIGDVFLPENIVESIILMIIPACYYCTSKGCQIFLKFLGKIFLKYQHLKLQMLDEILGKNSGIPSCKKCVYKYELQLGEYVHMSSVIVLHIIQCDLLIPETDGYSLESSSSINKDILKQLDKVTETATYFLSSLIDRCAKNADGLCVFVKFVMDLLLMTSKPQWPVVEVMLNTLGKLLLLKLPETIDTVDRLFSVDILCLITVGLKKNAAAMQLMPETENKILTLVSDKQLGIAENKKYIFQKVLLGFFSSHTQDNNARLFHLLEWYSDEIKSSTSTECTGKQEDVNSGTKKAFQIPVDWRQFLVSQLEQKSQNEIFDIGIKDIESVCWALSFSRSYSSSSFSYVNHIVSLLTDVSTAVRTKAVKCIVQILEADANILQEKGFLCIIKVCFRDQSSHVRESVVQLVGKLIMHHPEMTEELYDLLVARIVDTSITVRKQVVRILKTFCCHNIYPAKVPDMCFKMVKRINDDESIKKLVVEVFQDLWFKPTEIKASLSRRVSTIVTVVSISDGLSQSCLKELFENISVLQMKTGSSGITTGCKQLIGNFVVIIQDESSERQYVLQCVTALHLLSQVWPQLLVKHSGVLKTLLCRKCSVPQDYQVTSIIARMLTQIVPFLKNSCEFLVQLEKDIENLVIVRRFVFTIIQLMLRQGLVYRPQVLSHVIAMTTDFADSFVRCGAENLLKDSGRQIGTLQSKFQSGICLSFNFQMILPEQSAGRIIRGFCIKEGVSSAVNDFLYLLIRPWKQYRNTFLSVLVKNFDDSAYKCLSKMLYLADNLAHFSYGSQDEVLFLLNNITVVLSVFCANLQKLFNEKVKSDHSVCTNASGDRCDKMHLTDSTEILQEFIDASQGCILLLLLKEHLQKIYAINDEKIFHYTTSTSTKGYEKVVHKTGNFSFEPHPIIEKMKCLDVQKSSWDDLEQQVQYIKQFILMSDQGVERGNGQNNSSESEKY